MNDIIRIFDKIANANELLHKYPYKQHIMREEYRWGISQKSFNTDKNIFLKKYKNIHADNIGIIFAPGPSFDNIDLDKLVKYIKDIYGEKEIIGFGCSRIYRNKKIKNILTYYQFGDGFVSSNDKSYQKDISKFCLETPHITKFVSGYGNGKFKNGFNKNNIHLLEKINAKNILDTGNLYNLEKDISLYPLINHITGPGIVQFLSYTGIKNIFLVGVDATCCKGPDGVYSSSLASQVLRNESNKTGYSNTNQIIVPDPHMLYWWIRVYKFILQYYPDVKVSTINPVGLKGLFNDIYI